MQSFQNSSSEVIPQVVQCQSLRGSPWRSKRRCYNCFMHTVPSVSAACSMEEAHSTQFWVLPRGHRCHQATCHLESLNFWHFHTTESMPSNPQAASAVCANYCPSPHPSHPSPTLPQHPFPHLYLTALSALEKEPAASRCQGVNPTTDSGSVELGGSGLLLLGAGQGAACHLSTPGTQS